jgi:isoleucyl-tRNA synthetase
VDADLERAMAAAQAVVGLGRSLRQEAALKTRQPLGRLVMHAADDRATRVAADPRLRGYVADELNVKNVGTVADPREVAVLAAKADFRALGPRFGKGVPAAAARIAAMTADEIAVLRAEGRVELDLDGSPTIFSGEEITVREEGIAPWIAGGEQGLTVALDTTLTDDLRAEGLSREIINKVQNLRKKSGLEVSDRIELVITGPGLVQEAIAVHLGRIRGETLAVSVAEAGDLAYKDTFVIEGHEIGIGLKRA